MMKRRSMLGRRSRAVQQSPLSGAFPSQAYIPERTQGNHETPKPPYQDKDRSPHPFRTPSVDGSFSELSSRSTETWSVFKKSNVRTLKLPEDHGERRWNVETRIVRTSRLNRLKKNDPLSELRNNGFSNVLANKNGSNKACGSGLTKDNLHSSMVSSVISHNLKPDNYRLFKDIKVSVKPKENIDNQLMKESDGERVARELINLEKKWEHQDIRAVSPPWSNGHSTLSDSAFSLKSPRQLPTLIVSSPPKSPSRAVDSVDFSATLGVTPLESTVVDTKNVIAQEERDTCFTELESIVNEETVVNPQLVDLSSDLGSVSLGVNSIELLDKPNVNNLSKTCWSSKHKSPLSSVNEEPELSQMSKENIPPGDATEHFCSPGSSDETINALSDSLTPRTRSSRLFKQFQGRLLDLTSKIEAVEEKRLKAEEERKILEGERKRVFVEFFNFMQENEVEPLSHQVEKRRKLTSAKKSRPSIVASKLLKRDFKSPKDVSSFLRTPSQMTAPPASSFAPFTPRSLRKSVNQQLNSIFGS